MDHQNRTELKIPDISGNFYEVVSIGKGNQNIRGLKRLLNYIIEYFRECLIGHLFDGPSFRHVRVGDFAFVPFIRNIKITVATAVFGNVWLPVNTGTEDILVLFPVPGCQSARTGHVAITFLILKKGLQEVKDPIFVLVK
jgi:hypothetical protein